ncbi:GNAT family N-acetyltransferase [archaeon]|nr:MAG: GNAT family N-acetyltransferase [archaeon]
MTGASPGQVAYDRPSPKLIPFLHKHYDLHQPDLQPNRYTIFPKQFFA